MKIIKEEHLITSKEISSSEEFQKFYKEIKKAISKVRWPVGSDQFIIYPEKHGSGVSPIKDACMTSLKDDGWSLEHTMDIATHIRPGALDAVKFSGKNGLKMAVEWETGNISSSHRAVNKMCVGLLENKINAGVLILPTKRLSKWVTDRVGRFSELRPYFKMWKTLGDSCPAGNLTVIAVEHHGVSEEVPKIGKGTDGRALV